MVLEDNTILLVANEIIVSTIKKASCLFPSNLIYCFPKYVSSANSVYSSIAYYLEIYTTIARHVIQQQNYTLSLTTLFRSLVAIIVSTIKKASCFFPPNLIYCFPRYVSSANSVYSNIA